MPDYTLNIDSGASELGPWLRWYAAGSRDGKIAAGTFAVSESDGSVTPVNLSAGLVIDWPASRTGWMQAAGTPGVAPLKQWNASRAKMEPQPGKEWKRAHHTQVAYILSGTSMRAVWEQGQYAAWDAYRSIMGLIARDAQAQLPNLPLLAHTGHRTERLGTGMTMIPEFRLIRYVPRPACLLEEEDDIAPDASEASVAQPSGDPWGEATEATPRNGGKAQMPQSDVEDHDDLSRAQRRVNQWREYNNRTQRAKIQPTPPIDDETQWGDKP